MPGIFALVDQTDEILLSVKEMQQKLFHHKDWFLGKIFEIKNGYHGIVNFASKLEDSYAVSATGTQVLVYGELYPYCHNATEGLLINSATFVLSLYEQYGTKLVNYINGSFCISIYDHQTQQLFLITDRFGSKALYRDTRSEQFIVSSEIKAVLMSARPLRYNINSIINLFTFQHLLDQDTFFEGIEMIPPASILSYNVAHHQLHLASYWSYDLGNKAPEFTGQSMAVMIEKFDTAMTNSIRQKIGDAKKIGVFLSGGVDSRIVVSYAKEIADKTNKQLYAFTFGTEGGYQSKPTDEIARRLGIEHTFYAIPADTIAKHAQEVVWNGDGHIRIRDTHFIGLLETIRETVDVVLAGYMSDIFFGSHITETMVKLTDRQQLIDHMFARIQKDMGDIYDPVASLFTNGFIPDFNLKTREHFEASVNSIPGEICYKIAHYWDIYQRGRRYIMPISNYPRWYIPCLDPFIDNQVVDFALSLPPELFVYKQFLKKLLEQRFPILNEIEFEKAPPLNTSHIGHFLFRLNRYVQRKTVSTIQKYSQGNILVKNKDYRAYNYWLRTASKEFVRNMVNDSSYFEGLFIDQATVEKVLEEHLTCRKEYDDLICDILTFMIMHRYFMNPKISVC